VSGQDCINHFTKDELIRAGVSPETLANPDYVRSQGVLPHYDKFDAQAFGLSLKEADLMDPQLRVLLECAWDALDHAACVPGDNERIGVFAGAYYGLYRDLALLAGYLKQDNDAFITNLLNEKDFLASRIAYHLNLVGPAVTVQSACSTSLTAVHLATQALLAGECDTCLAGGATARPVQVTGYQYQKGGIFSPDGKTRTFDAKAQGTVPSNGAGMVVLRRLEDALAEGDRIWGVIRGSAMGNDGGRRVGFSAPGVSGQARIISAALAVAGVKSSSVNFIETHGSGTALGDPIEIDALMRAYGPGLKSNSESPCWIGSVKTNIGHTHAASGVAGLIKATLALNYLNLPSSLNFQSLNSNICLDETRLRIATDPVSLASQDMPPRAAVSSFGMGGTGVHMILEAAAKSETLQDIAVAEDRSGPVLVTMSALSDDALDEGADRISQALDDEKHLKISDVAATLHKHRRHMPQRLALLAHSTDEASRKLLNREDAGIVRGLASKNAGSIAFLFPGLGDNRPGMGHELYATSPVFRDAVDKCLSLLKTDRREAIREALLASPQQTNGSNKINLKAMLGRSDESAQYGPMADTATAQPAVFIFEYALAEHWRALGIIPSLMIGYSIGEYVAACQSGLYCLEEALQLVVRRAELIGLLPNGAMVAVPLPEKEVVETLPSSLSLSAVTGKSMCVIGGPVEEIDAYITTFIKKDIPVKKLETSHAFHSTMMLPCVDELRCLVAQFKPGEIKVPFTSNVTGTFVTQEMVADTGYWARHMCEPVRFSDAVKTVLHAGASTLLEVGPGQSTAAIAQAIIHASDKEKHDCTVVSSMPSAHNFVSPEEHLLKTTGRLWTLGHELNAEVLFKGKDRKVALPGYAFQRKRHWITEISGETDPQSTTTSSERRVDISDWFAFPGWETCRDVFTSSASVKHCVIIFADHCGVAEKLEKSLLAAGRKVLVVHNDNFKDEEQREDEIHAFLEKSSSEEADIIHLCNLDLSTDDFPALDMETFKSAQSVGFESFLYIARIIGRLPSSMRLNITAACCGAYKAPSDVSNYPPAALTAAALRTLPAEHPGTHTRLVDFPLGPVDAKAIANRLMLEIADHNGEPVKVIRKNRIWRPTHDDGRIEAAQSSKIIEGGVYLITGGLGGIGRSLALHLASKARIKLVILSRRPLESYEEDDPQTAQVHSDIDAIRATGSQIMLKALDVGDREAVSLLFREITTAFGRLNGIFHAAGVEGRGLMQLKKDKDADLVFRPKCLGALHLIEQSKPLSPDFIILFSSTIAFGGVAGQSDYAAANAFLDALSENSEADGPTRIISINWEAWRETGMAFRNLATEKHEKREKLNHPLVSECWRTNKGNLIYEALIDIQSCWMVDEHRMDGHAVVPGTGHLEMVRAAITHALSGEADPGFLPIELSDITFFSPVVVEEGTTRVLHIELVPRNSGNGQRSKEFNFSVFSSVQTFDELPQNWCLNVSGQAMAFEPDEEPTLKLPDEITLAATLKEHGPLSFDGPMGLGPRSRSLKTIRFSDLEALAEVSIGTAYASDFSGLHLHPSIMDISAAFVGLHLAKRFRIPIRYGRLRLHRPLEPHVFSHHVLSQLDDGDETQTADFTIRNLKGQTLVEVNDFVLKHIENVDGHMSQVLSGTSRELVHLKRHTTSQNNSASLNALSDDFSNGISIEEGMHAIDRILKLPQSGHCTVSPVALSAIMKKRAKHADHVEVSAAQEDKQQQLHQRPETGTPYLAPRNGMETELAVLWSGLLGIVPIGVHDNFFEIGGHSLLGLSLVSQIRSRMAVDVPVGTLFRCLTIEKLASEMTNMRVNQ